MNKMISSFIGTVLICSTHAAFAHHSFAMFDMQKEVKLEGTVREFQWTNPHTWIEVNVKGDDGKVVQWSIECSSPAKLTHQGWGSKSIKVGDKISVVVHPLKDGTTGASFVRAVVNDKPLGSTEQAPPAN